MSEAPFNPKDPFDASTEDLRLTLVTAVVSHVQHHPAFKLLDKEKRFESILIATLVASVGCTSVLLSPGSEKALLKTMKNYLPTALKVAGEISLDGEMRAAEAEVKH